MVLWDKSAPEFGHLTSFSNYVTDLLCFFWQTLRMSTSLSVAMKDPTCSAHLPRLFKELGKIIYDEVEKNMSHSNEITVVELLD